MEKFINSANAFSIILEAARQTFEDSRLHRIIDKAEESIANEVKLAKLEAELSAGQLSLLSLVPVTQEPL